MSGGNAGYTDVYFNFPDGRKVEGKVRSNKLDEFNSELYKYQRMTPRRG